VADCQILCATVDREAQVGDQRQKTENAVKSYPACDWQVHGAAIRRKQETFADGHGHHHHELAGGGLDGISDLRPDNWGVRFVADHKIQSFAQEGHWIASAVPLRLTLSSGRGSSTPAAEGALWPQGLSAKS